ncbi:MAG: transcription-repair coupling factor [Planctomycetes bacterium]|nr:transcription-repair coupling factor [Planctomycetota bacterium]
MDLGQDKTVAEIISRLQAQKKTTRAQKIEGTWGSFAPMLIANLSKHLKSPILYIRPHIDDADKAADDLHAFGAKSVAALGAWEGLEDIADATDEIRSERIKVALKLLAGTENLIIPTSVQALCQPIPKPNTLKHASLKLNVNQDIKPDTIIEWLVDNSFESVDRIDLPGQFARRGGIVDIYAPLVNEIITDEKENAQSEQPFRIEFFADTIESIRQINLDNNLSTNQIRSIDIISSVCGTEQKDRELFVNILPENTIIALEEPTDIEEVAKIFLERIEDSKNLYTYSDIFSAMQKFPQLHISRFAAVKDEDSLKVNIKSIQHYQQKTTSLWATHKAALEQLILDAKQGKKVFLYCERSAEISRVTEIIEQINKKIPANFNLVLGFINQGFIIDSINTIIISHHELFGQFALRRRQRPTRASLPVDTLADLQLGDYVVHISYGIGKFLGIQTIKEKGGTSEFLTIEYADKTKIHVSTTNIALIQKYIGTSPKRPTLSKIGSKKWQKQKQKVAESVRDLANELLQVQAKRKTMEGIAFQKDSNYLTEFEESFPYQETPDQITAIQQIKTDMHQPIAMDRLLCGDVGYGKTELAMRAAFKAVENQKQVAILVPTTVLSVQHQRTFSERFADFPISIETLNRFKTKKQASEIIKKTKKGTVDILIGTHRLLSKDVGFKNLGLLIIDEEQRFGVEHKEKLKRMRINVDILTMTATPIPRTLHMALLGLRDISSLQTPPLDRRSIVTSVTAYNAEMLKKAIHRELNRQGQVFYLHNRVKTIDKKAFEIQKLVPDAKIDIAHGQMKKRQLEKAMIDFVIGNTDVLVCTTIIESGLDIPNANTIFIDNADRFGLAELHQLRGRVGRYKHRAYAYMLLPKNRSITPIAARRLKAIEEYSHLGAGFRIALRDLEIRGAGNILGAAQSGHIQLVGYQMYCEMLADAVRKLKGQPTQSIPTTNLDLGFAVYVPKNYIANDRQRMDVYRKIAVAKNDHDLDQLKKELSDVYGAMPDEVEVLLELAMLRILASKHGIKSILTSKNTLIFTFEKENTHASTSLFKKTTAKITIPDKKTVYLHLDKNYFEPQTLITVLRKILSD